MELPMTWKTKRLFSEPYSLEVDIEYDGTKLRADAIERDQALKSMCHALRCPHLAHGI